MQVLSQKHAPCRNGRHGHTERGSDFLHNHGHMLDPQRDDGGCTNGATAGQGRHTDAVQTKTTPGSAAQICLDGFR